MNSKEIVLGSLVRSEIEDLRKKYEFWGVPITIPEGQEYRSKNCLTLDEFLEKHPVPAKGEDIAIYGIAWEFVWGKPVPEIIEKTKETLKIRARTGMPISETEELWLKVMTIDTDYF